MNQSFFIWLHLKLRYIYIYICIYNYNPYFRIYSQTLPLRLFPINWLKSSQIIEAGVYISVSGDEFLFAEVPQLHPSLAARHGLPHDSRYEAFQ